MKEERKINFVALYTEELLKVIIMKSIYSSNEACVCLLLRLQTKVPYISVAFQNIEIIIEQRMILTKNSLRTAELFSRI
jgi:hypothetical protein